MPDNSKPPIGVSPLRFTDELRDRIDYNRAIEISTAIINYCADQKIWPEHWNQEMDYIFAALVKRKAIGGLTDV